MRHDTEQNDTQHIDIEHNAILAFRSQHNDIEHNDTQHVDTQNNDIEQYAIQAFDTCHNGIEHPAGKRTCERSLRRTYVDFELGDGSVGFAGARPPSAHAFVALLDDVVRHWHAAVVTGWLPLKHAVL
jgi:hypothetical protein